MNKTIDDEILELQDEVKALLKRVTVLEAQMSVNAENVKRCLEEIRK